MVFAFGIRIRSMGHVICYTFCLSKLNITIKWGVKCVKYMKKKPSHRIKQFAGIKIEIVGVIGQQINGMNRFKDACLWWWDHNDKQQPQFTETDIIANVNSMPKTIFFQAKTIQLRCLYYTLRIHKILIFIYRRPERWSARAYISYNNSIIS